MSSRRTHFKSGVTSGRAREKHACGQREKLGPNVAGLLGPERVQKSMEEVTRSKRGPNRRRGSLLFSVPMSVSD